MWLMTKYGFLSIVEHRNIYDAFLVRARHPEHIVKNLSIVFKDLTIDDIEYNPEADYEYRIVLEKDELIQFLNKYVQEELKYDNFKKEAEEEWVEEKYSQFLNDVWRLGYFTYYEEE